MTLHTDFALRILIEAALQPDRLLSIATFAADHGISRNHVMKVVSTLAQVGLLETVRGRGGGFRLGRPADSITLGEVVRLTEPSLQPADCASCMFNSGCGLTPVLGEAVQAFLATLDSRTVADVARTTTPPFPRSGGMPAHRSRQGGGAKRKERA